MYRLPSVCLTTSPFGLFYCCLGAPPTTSHIARHMRSGGARALPPDEAPLPAASVHSTYHIGRVSWNTGLQSLATLARARVDSPHTATPPRRHVRRTPDRAATRLPVGKATIGAPTWPTSAPPKGGMRWLHLVFRSTSKLSSSPFRHHSVSTIVYIAAAVQCYS